MVTEDSQNQSDEERKRDLELKAAAEKQEKEKQKLDKTSKSFRKSLKSYLQTLLSLKEGVDHEGTAKGIKQDIEFRGHAAWILVCSILIASLGLNINSPAVVIGAMLISPLMGPIIGVGFAAGTNDWELLKKAIKNFGTTILISLVISTLYFKLTPFKDINEELLSRTSATIFAILVAFTGGAAGIIAGSRTLKSNVVPGVAIATALMPPLCTAGYGIAIWNWSYFMGAFYLFVINSVFIALPTYLYIRYLKFPVKQFVDPLMERKIKRYFLVFLIVVIVPSGITFYNVLKETIAQRNAVNYMAYVEQETKKFGTYVISPDIHSSLDSISCTIPLRGNTLSEDVILRLTESSKDFGVDSEKIQFIQEKDIDSILANYNSRENSALSEKDRHIQQLELDNQLLRSKLDNSVTYGKLYEEVNKELRSLFEDIEVSYFISEFQSESKTLLYAWNHDLLEEDELKNDSIIRVWLPLRLPNDSIEFRKLEIQKKPS